MNSDSKISGSARLVASGPPGVELRVLDSGYGLLARGMERLDQRFEPGVYVIQWLDPKAAEEKILLLMAGKTARVSAERKTPDRRRGRAIKQAGQGRPLRRHQAAVIVLKEADDARLKGRISKDVRLFNDHDVAMRSDRNLLEGWRDSRGVYAKTGLSWAVRYYGVEPGAFRLRYDTMLGETLDQTVVAIAGRETIVILRQSVGKTVVPLGEGVTFVSQVGADPARTIIVSAPPGGEGVDFDLAASLLSGLSSARDTLSRETLQRIELPQSDPLLKLYAAALILLRLELDSSPALDELWPGQESKKTVQAFRAGWRRRARRLLALLPRGMESLADVSACRVVLGAPSRKTPPAAPPMLACCWRWLRDAHQEDLPSTPHFRAALQGGDGHGVWLMTRASAAKAGLVEVSDTMTISVMPPEARAGSSETMGKDADETVDAEFEAVGVKPEYEPKAAPLKIESLTLPSSLGFVGAILAGAFFFRDTLDASKGFLTHRGLMVGVVALAYAGMMAVWARRLLTGFFEQIFSAGEAAHLEIPRHEGRSEMVTYGGAQVELAMHALNRSLTRAPALDQPILQRDDPNKGRFGGAAAVKGFTLSADFRDTPKPDWVEIRLEIVGGPEADLLPDDQVTVFLHDTYSPSVYDVAFVDRRAQLSMHAFGGFTVGAWLPRQKVQLELDLAELPGAPVVVREW